MSNSNASEKRTGLLDPMRPPIRKRQRTVGAVIQHSVAEAEPAAYHCPHLPDTIMGAALDYLQYAEVRNALLAGKFIAVDSVKHVQTLSICSTAEMAVRAARRFDCVTDVNILCLLSDDVEQGTEHDAVFRLMSQYSNSVPSRLSRDCALRAVPFLSSFPKLETIFIGGMSKSRSACTSESLEYDIKYQYNHLSCTAPDNHRELYRGLLGSFCGAFVCGALPEKMAWKGNVCGGGICNGFGRNASCEICEAVCRCFPFEQVMCMEYAFSDFAFCISRGKQFEILYSRPGGREFLQSETKA